MHEVWRKVIEAATCPKCGSRNGMLGTSYAYFVCRECGREEYWAENKNRDWKAAVLASPYGCLGSGKELFKR